jgi:oligopeptide/dipeptide ABC transporter ATP-binding protein
VIDDDDDAPLSEQAPMSEEATTAEPQPTSDGTMLVEAPPMSEVPSKAERRLLSKSPLVQVDKLSKLYQVRGGLFAKPRFIHAVDGVSFHIRRGETLGLVGESGSGKSTLGRTLLRLTEPTLGRVFFDGAEITRMRADDLRTMRQRMQIIFQDPYASLNPRMTVRDIVGEGITIFRLAPGLREADAMIAAVLEKVGLGREVLGRYPHEFSGGQRQRIGIARALAVRPDFIVCDEPVSALDVSVQAQVMNLLEQIQEELGVSLLFISHDLRAVQYTSHRIAVMYLGRIVEIGPTADVASKRLHPYTRALFSAIPSLDPDGKRRLVLTGEPPSALAVPRGCGFFSRCPKAEKGKCDVEVPTLLEVTPGEHHRVACFYPEEE